MARQIRGWTDPPAFGRRIGRWGLVGLGVAALFGIALLAFMVVTVGDALSDALR